MKKVILITGTSSGLGEYLAEYLRSKNYVVYGGDRSVEKKSAGHEIKLDITNDADCQSAVSYILKKEGKIDVLINNAGISLSGPTDSFTPEDLTKIINTNTIGAFRLIKKVLPAMRENKSGKIINITSMNALVALPNFGLYCSSKFALEALGLSLRYELYKNGIIITNVTPGAINNPNAIKNRLVHRTAREKFWLIKTIMPMLNVEKIAAEIEKIIETDNPPARVVLGNDAKITFLLQRLLPASIWDKLVLYVWNKK